ncbi:34116_t:CDS:2, partial [Gigaspora margarita]
MHSQNFFSESIIFTSSPHLVGLGLLEPDPDLLKPDTSQSPKENLIIGRVSQ